MLLLCWGDIVVEVDDLVVKAQQGILYLLCFLSHPWSRQILWTLCRHTRKLTFWCLLSFEDNKSLRVIESHLLFPNSRSQLNWNIHFSNLFISVCPVLTIHRHCPLHALSILSDYANSRYM